MSWITVFRDLGNADAGGPDITGTNYRKVITCLIGASGSTLSRRQELRMLSGVSAAERNSCYVAAECVKSQSRRP